MLIAVVLLSTPVVAHAEESDGDRPRSGGVDALTALVEESQAALDEVTARLEELDAEREKLRRDMTSIRRSKDRTEDAIARNRREIERLGDRIAADERRIERLRDLLKNRAVAAFVTGDPHLSERILDPDSAADADDVHVYLTALNESDDELAARIEADAKTLRRDRRRQRRRRVELADRLEALERFDESLEEKGRELFLVTLATREEAAEAEEMVDQALELAAMVSAPGARVALDGRPLCDVAGFTVVCDIAFDVARMVAAAEKDGVTLSGSGWRDTARQIELRRAHCGGDVFGAPASSCSPPTARPGSSQHERGLAIDFSNCSQRDTACFRWLAENAAEFGFKNLPSEPWHWSTTGS